MGIVRVRESPRPEGSGVHLRLRRDSQPRRVLGGVRRLGQRLADGVLGGRAP